MTSTKIEQLVRYVRSLPEFVIYTTIDGNYNHIGATVADAILQANNRYSTNVKPRVNRILATYPDAHTTAAALNLLKRIGAKEFLSWRGEDRAERFRQVLHLFEKEHIENEADLRVWLLDGANILKLREINGIGPKTADYFKILVGLSTSAIDRHLLNFLKMAGVPSNDYNEAQIVINLAADRLNIDRAYFDHSIWQFMSKRVVKPNSTKCCSDRA